MMRTVFLRSTQGVSSGNSFGNSRIARTRDPSGYLAGNCYAEPGGSSGPARDVGRARRGKRRASRFVRSEPFQSGPHRDKPAGRIAAPGEFERRGPVHGEFAGSQPGAGRSARYEFAGNGVAGRPFDGRKSVRCRGGVGWAPGRNQFIRRDSSGNGRFVRQLQSDRRRHAGSAVVLFPDAGGQRDLLFVDRIHFGCAAGLERIGDPYSASREPPSHGGILPRRAHSALRSVLAISLCLAEVMGKHGGAASNISGWANAGEGWAVVFDGHGAPAFSVDARCTLVVCDVGDVGFHGTGLLGGSGNAAGFLAAVHRTARFSGNAAAGNIADAVHRDGDVRTDDRGAGAEARGSIARELEEAVASRIWSDARGSGGGMRLAIAVARGDSRIARGPRGSAGPLGGKHAALGLGCFSIRGISPLRGFDGDGAFSAADTRELDRGRIGGGAGSAAEPGGSAIRTGLPGVSGERAAVARESRGGVPFGGRFAWREHARGQLAGRHTGSRTNGTRHTGFRECQECQPGGGRSARRRSLLRNF